ncbi:MAG TPA: TlpA disulfide reductase family protein [Noviherbaspirillum sp.]|jgi:thiol-disulfide isomerase/thioredoxin|uniref:peroxiredoxin family protein n=1 Tax=Noviherbaspirillum sp. TaxID=1926288 RepID=UPI002DDD5ABA|nr:TlpA disulfide reductase family protein [Noviherbaspirillum sp.]HEV2610107.1 TlpA disulfide reductase family protein [Noviherbaspirillum sp.]
MREFSLYPELDVVEWINTTQPIRMTDLRGRVVVLHAFQMLCPGCVQYGIPQAERIARAFPRKDVAVLGLHTVFEHHDVMTPAALRAFASEYRLSMPIGIDRPADEGSIPRTMKLLQLRGTPTLVIFDKTGRVRHQHLGQVDDLRVGAEIGALLMEQAKNDRPASADNGTALLRTGECDDEACRVNEPPPLA